MSEKKLKEIDTMDQLFDDIRSAEEDYRHGLSTKGACILQLEDLIAEIKMNDLADASVIASEYGMKLVPAHWKQEVPK